MRGGRPCLNEEGFGQFFRGISRFLVESVVMVKISALCCFYILGHYPSSTKILDIFGMRNLEVPQSQEA